MWKLFLEILPSGCFCKNVLYWISTASRFMAVLRAMKSMSSSVRIDLPEKRNEQTIKEMLTCLKSKWAIKQQICRSTKKVHLPCTQPISPPCWGAFRRPARVRMKKENHMEIFKPWNFFKNAHFRTPDFYSSKVCYKLCPKYTIFPHFLPNEKYIVRVVHRRHPSSCFCQPRPTRE